MPPDRITSSVIEQQLERLSNKTGEEFQLDTWRPGDGWTRYQLFLANEDNSGLTRVTQVLNNREMYYFIEGYIQVEKKLEE